MKACCMFSLEYINEKRII